MQVLLYTGKLLRENGFHSSIGVINYYTICRLDTVNLMPRNGHVYPCYKLYRKNKAIMVSYHLHMYVYKKV